MLVMLNLPLMVIGLATLLVSGWSYYHGRRFAGRERRRAPGRVMGDALAQHFGVHPADLARWQSARRLRVRHDIRGLVIGVESELGVDKVDRRPPNHADPLPWIEGLVVGREEIITAPVPRRTQITRHMIEPSVTRAFDSDIDLASLLDLNSPMAGSDTATVQGRNKTAPFFAAEDVTRTHAKRADTGPVFSRSGDQPAARTEPRATSEARSKASLTPRHGAATSEFDPASLADLGLFDELNTHSTTARSADSDAAPASAFQHEGRVYYI